MLNLLKDLLTGEQASKPAADRCIKQVAAALMIEVARADNNVQKDELAKITELIARHQDLDYEVVKAIVNEAHLDSDDATSLFEFTKVVNDTLDDPKKLDLVLNMWRIAWVDGEIDPNEEHIIRRVSDLIYIPHAKFMWARSTARDELPSS